MSHKQSRNLIAVWTVLFSLLLLTLLFLPGNAWGNDGDLLPAPVQLRSHELDVALSPIGPHSVISPTSEFVLYSRSDSTVWLKDTAGDAMLMDGEYPRLSPDGGYIIYRQGSIHLGDLYVRDLQNGQDTLIFSNNDYVDSFSWAPSGAQIVFDYACGIYVIDRDGTNQQQLIGAWPPSGYCLNDAPHSNPVDGRIAWLNWSYSIAVADSDGQNPYWVPNTFNDDIYPVWSPDGQWFAFLRDYANLYKIRPDGTDLTQLTFLADPDWIVDTGGWAWTAEGSWLVYAAEMDGVIGLYAAATDGSGRMMPLSTALGEDPIYVGSVGSLQIHRIFLPLALKE